MKKLRLLSLAGLFAIGIGATVSTPAIGSTAIQQRVRALSYTDGYNQGYNETLQNKCIDGDLFEYRYASNYEPTAQRNFAAYDGTPDGEYYGGYLDGLHTAYGDVVVCP